MNILDCRAGERIPWGETLDVPGTLRRFRIKAPGTPKTVFDPFQPNGVLGDLCEVVEPDGSVNAALTEEFFRCFLFESPSVRALRDAAIWLTNRP